MHTACDDMQGKALMICNLAVDDIHGVRRDFTGVKGKPSAGKSKMQRRAKCMQVKK